MNIKNPFTKLVASIQRKNTSLRERKNSSRKTSPQDWQANLVPFSSESGMAHEEFKGSKRILLFQVLTIFLFGILFFRLFDLKVVQGEELKSKADVNYRRFHQIRANRGLIYDRNQVALATNEPSYSLILNASKLPDNVEEEKNLFVHLASLFELSIEDISQTVNEAKEANKDRISIPADITREQAINFMARQNELPGASVEILPKRSYPLGDKLAHVLGYMSEVYDYELENDSYYLAGDIVGRDGIERTYESYLRGIKGTGIVEIDALGKELYTRVDPDHDPQTGQNLVLTIDSELQKVVVDALQNGAEKAKGQGAAAIVLDVNTGEILSLASWPSFDNNIFSSTIKSADLEKLYTPDAKNPLFNRAISGTYPPGSIFKPLVASAALQEKVITPYTYVSDPGYISVGGSTFPCWIYGQYGGSHGSLNVVGALAKSCDVFFYEVGASYEQQEGLGSEMIKLYAEDFGLGQQSGIDIPGEASGSVPAKSDYELEGESWYWGNTAHMAIGQAYTMVTPLQMVNAIAAVANGGTLYKPHLVKEIQASTYAEAKTIEPEIIRDDFVSDTYLKTVRQGMREAVIGSGGTSVALADLPQAVAGKTGTAEHNKNKEPHAWFVSFAPYDDPKIATIVLVEEGGEGSQTSIPITEEILKWYFANR